MYPGNVPDSSPTTITTTTTWISVVSDFLPDSGLLRVLMSALLHAVATPPSSSCLSPRLLCQQLYQSGTQDHREHPGIIIVLLSDRKSLAFYQF